MARYILLRVEDDEEADHLLLDWHLWDGKPLLTPVREHPVHAEVVQGLTDGDWVVARDAGTSEGDQLLHEVSASYMRAGDLHVAYDEEG